MGREGPQGSLAKIPPPHQSESKLSAGGMSLGCSRWIGLGWMCWNYCGSQ
jgi:hypothetical protein